MKHLCCKALLIALVLLLFTSVFLGCSEKKESDNTVSISIDEAFNKPADSDSKTDGFQEPAPDIEIQSGYYDGADFVVLCAVGNEDSDIFYDTELSDVLDKEIKARNEAVEAKLGIKIQEKPEQEIAEYVYNLSNSEQAPDLVYASGNGGMSELMLYGQLASLSDYRGQGTTAVGISVSVVQQLSVYGELYMLTGAPIRSSIDSAAVTAYNTKALEAVGYENEYLNELVLEGDWTLDKMTAISKQASVANSSDNSYRAVSGNQSSLYSLWKGLGARTVEKANGDIPTVAVYSPKNVYLFEEVNSFSNEVGGIPDTDKSLFYIGKISDARSAFKDDFGVLPIPSYNEDGEYTCLLDFDSTYFTAMPTEAESRVMSLDFLREFYAESVDSVYPVITGDSCYKDTRVLDIILKSRYFDFLDMYGIGHIVSTVFYSQTDRDDFDALLKTRADFAKDALEIALNKTVGENTNKN